MSGMLVGIAGLALLFAVVGLLPLATSKCGSCPHEHGCTSCTLDLADAEPDGPTADRREHLEIER